MDRIAAFAYTQARLQAHQGMRPDAGTWRRLDAVRDLAAFLRDARETALRPWVLGLEAGFTMHQMELALRREFGSYVALTASWQPREWQAAVDWVRHLPALPALQYLLLGKPEYPWMLADPTLQAFAHLDPDARLTYLLHSEFAPLTNTWRAGIPLPAGWRQHWKSLWPHAPKALTAPLDALADAIEEQMAAATGNPDADGWKMREDLEAQLSLAFHHHIQQPAAVFLHLALVALDVEKLRAALVDRVLFPSVDKESP
ncbi:MAG: hypothetical protein ACOY4L_06945 [Pseudomonadota bacterium]